ncbi:MAG: D-alanyl-D-alanine carboxypeptidase [Alistipes sp.]|nr:D-alanyl-D-alanine carboxypeptidase [Alistipes sp.]
MSKKYKIRKGNLFLFLAAAAALILLVRLIIPKEKVADTPTYNIIIQSSEAPTENATSASTVPEVQIQTTTIPFIAEPACNGAALYCVDDGQMLYSYNIEEKAAPASLTKLLTAAVALEYLDNDDIIYAGSEQYLVQSGSSLCGLQYGSYSTVNDFVAGLLMSSGNDAAYALATSTARKVYPENEMSDDAAVNVFCGLMNTTAQKIGMTGSVFTTPDGWDDTNQYTTVSDLLLLTEYTLKIPKIKEIVGTQSQTVVFGSGEVYDWTNSNLLLDPYSDYFRQDAVGVKTGTTLNAGNNLISAFVINGKTYISVVVGCATDTDRYELTLKLIDAVS